MTPVTLLTGFLGAGKTTLLRRVLAEIGEGTVVIENEFGAANLDSEVLEEIQPGMVRQINGCICCAVIGDLAHTFGALLEARAEGTIDFERVIIETTGMAEPGGLVEVFFRGDALGNAFYVESIVTVVDAVNARRDLLNSPTAQGQVALADVLILNKLDRVDHGVVDALVDQLTAANPTAVLHQTTHANVPVDAVLGTRRFDALRLVHRPHAHEAMMSVLVEDEGPHDLGKIRAWLAALVEARPYDYYRYKGVVHAPGRVFVQGVHDVFAVESIRDWSDQPRRTRLVFIGLDLDERSLQTGLEGARRTD